jgi:integrase
MSGTPHKHPDTGVFYFRRKVPLRLVGRVGKSWIKKSLGTKDPREAKALFAKEATRVEELFRNADKLVTLSFRQVTALAGDWYIHRLRAEEDEPGDLDGLGDLLDDLRITPSDREKVRLLGAEVSKVLESKGLIVDEDSRVNLTSAIFEKYKRLVWTLSQRAKGDYSEDQTMKDLPKFSRESKKAQVSFSDLFAGWKTETGPRTRTASEFQRAIDRLSDFLSHTDASRVGGEDIAAFKANLLAGGKSSKTVKNNLSAIGAIYGWAVRNHRIKLNPTTGVTIKVKRHAGRRSFTLDEAKLILRAAKKEKGAKHWVPLVLAYSGARIGEVAQILREDVRQVDGVWCLDINEDQDKSLKNYGSARLIPLHPAVIEAGFVTYALKVGKGKPIFAEFKKRAKGTRGDNATQAIRRWIRGDKVGISDIRIGPCHSWRHSFKDACREADIRNEIQDEITGHRVGSVARSYGASQFPVKVLNSAIRKLPTIKY